MLADMLKDINDSNELMQLIKEDDEDAIYTNNYQFRVCTIINLISLLWKEINGNKDNTEFKEFIPIEVIKYFFENLKLRINNQRVMVNS